MFVKKHQLLIPLGGAGMALLRALTSHQCGPGSIPGPRVMWVDLSLP